MATFPALAQNSEGYRACNHNAQTQSAMNACANKESERVDAELNRAYRKLLSITAKDPEAVEKIKAAENAWITYRDAYMEAMYPTKDKQAEYGSIYPMEADLLRARLTQQHILALKQLARQRSGAK